MEPERIDAPFTVTLTDMDFNALAWEVGGPFEAATSSPMSGRQNGLGVHHSSEAGSQTVSCRAV